MIAFPTEKRNQTQSITLRCEKIKNGECLTEWKTLTGGQNELLQKKLSNRLSEKQQAKFERNGTRFRQRIAELQ